MSTNTLVEEGLTDNSGYYQISSDPTAHSQEKEEESDSLWQQNGRVDQTIVEGGVMTMTAGQFRKMRGRRVSVEPVRKDGDHTPTITAFAKVATS